VLADGVKCKRQAILKDDVYRGIRPENRVTVLFGLREDTGRDFLLRQLEITAGVLE
jgi:hypothetical protein